jgi:hypothetical protein
VADVRAEDDVGAGAARALDRRAKPWRRTREERWRGSDVVCGLM